MKKIRMLLPTGAVIGMLVVGTAFPAMAAADSDTAKFVRGTTINAVDVSKQTAQQAKGYLEGYFNEHYEIKIQDADGNLEVLKGTDVGYHLNVTGSVDDILKEQNDTGRKTGPGSDQSYTVTVEATLDDGKLAAALANLHCVTAATPTSNAYISAYEEGKPFTIVPEVQGNELDMDKMKAAVKSALLSQKKQIRLADEDCYKKITVKSDDANLVQLCTTLNAYKDIQITYVFGSSRETLDGLELAKWVTGTNGTEIQVDRDKAVAYVKSLADKYDTYGNHKYKTTSGRDVVVYGKYGWKINQAAETEALAAIIASGESTTREPEYSQKAASHGANDYGDTYVEINLTGQHLFFYKEGKLVVESDFVSGNLAKGWGTPAGSYPLAYKQKNAVLKGENYRTPVNYWMPFNNGIGMHDAKWRSSFGGTIYKTGGSHGCINLPPSVAKTIFDNISAGTPVICYNLPGTEKSTTSGTAKPAETKPAETQAPAETAAPPETQAPAPAETQAPGPAPTTAPTQAETKAPETAAPTQAGPGGPSGDNGGNIAVGPGA